MNYQTKIGTLLGSVIITQGTLTIHADKIVFHQNPDNSMSATAFGNPITFREKRDGVDEYYEGVAQRAEYDGQKRFLELFDRALLRKGTDEIRSNYISYNARDRSSSRPKAAPTRVLPARASQPWSARARRLPAAAQTRTRRPRQKARRRAGRKRRQRKQAPKPGPPVPLKPDGAIGASSANDRGRAWRDEHAVRSPRSTKRIQVAYRSCTTCRSRLPAAR